jgi:uncharacterized protein with ParB-like and HNH nuclease domain
MIHLENKIEAKNRSIIEVLDNKKYTVDYYQREYSWKKEHIEQLISDLCNAFLINYSDEHERRDVASYNSYYLGPFVLSERGGKRSIIDGQQRLTSMTLLLIYLNHLQDNIRLDDMIFSDEFGDKSFNIDVPERIECLEGLYTKGEYSLEGQQNASVINMVKRYHNIEETFPDEIKASNVLPLFVDWLTRLVVLVEIVAYSNENAYTIFETMNDRGLNLTPTEMLKGFLLSKYNNDSKRNIANDLWKKVIINLKGFDKEEDQRFVQSWLRGKYAETMRQRKADATNADFEIIGTRFHNWVRDNQPKLNLTSLDEQGFHTFIHEDFKFYANAYERIKKAELNLTDGLEHVYYIAQWGIASSLGYPLMLAPLMKEDGLELANKKINLVAKYIDVFCVRRSINFRNFSSSSISYTIYNLIKEIRNKSYDELVAIFTSKLHEMEDTFEGFDTFKLHGQNKRFVKYLLSRISNYVDELAGEESSFVKYYKPNKGKAYEIEHLWANTYEVFKDTFEQRTDFEEFRNKIGGLVLLPNGTNQSYGDKSYEEKLNHYVKENFLVKSLHQLTYENNPNFKKLESLHGLKFKPHPSMNKEDIEERQRLYKDISKQIWAIELNKNN